MKFSWFRWRLALCCVAVGLVLPVITVIQALGRASELSQFAGDYLRDATFSSDTLTTLAIWTIEIAVVLYLVSLLVLHFRERREKRGAASQSSLSAVRQDPGLTIPGWRIVKQGERITAWQDVDGDALTLTRQPLVWFPDLADENAVRRRCRELGETMSSGLIEAAVVTAASGPAVMFILKRLDKPAFIFTGMLVVASASKTSSVWTVVAPERGTTGVREAVVTARLINEGKLTLESYETSWAQEPYDPTHRGVDRETLRYLSDDESYDAQFPEHPLSKVRRELRRLLAVKLPPLGDSN